MEPGSSSDRTKARAKPGPWPPRIEPFVPGNTDFNPRDLKSWAKRTGFNPNVSGESVAQTDAGGGGGDRDLEKGVPRPEIESAAVDEGFKGGFKERRRIGVERRPEVELKDKNEGLNLNGIGIGNGSVDDVGLKKEKDGGGPAGGRGREERDVDLDFFSESMEHGNSPSGHKSGLVCGLTENPGYGRLIFYGVQHYLSLAGSLVFIPIIMVPTMGGTDEETATVISTMLLVSAITTIMQSFFGTRLPLVQGSSFVYLAPALVIINSEEFRNLSENKFKHIMRELQGAIIVGSVFQTLLGYSGLMSLLLSTDTGIMKWCRIGQPCINMALLAITILLLINPVVVAPTVAAVGLAFFSYGFPQAGTCAGISIPLILLVLVFTLYLRRISIFGHRIFLVYAVPLSVAIVWAYAFFLTAGGAYNYKGCTSNIPSSNILLDGCRRHSLTMKYCRTDVSSAWKNAAWVRVPYPFQWGFPTFHFKTSIIMVIASLVASVDSIGSYHATSLLVNMRPPTPGIVTRGIGLEGFSSILAGLWGTGTGSTTLTENVHTLDVTKMASRKALELGAALLIIFSFVGKIGALIASIPLALAASVLCFTWALSVALGLSTLQYTQSASSRNIIIVGFTLFISLSIPAYFQQYQPVSSLILPSYLVPYAAGSAGPVDVGSKGLNYALNSLLSLNMVVALLVAFALDNTVPGSKEERGVYIWSDSSSVDSDPAALDLYMLPKRIGSYFRWAKCVGS